MAIKENQSELDLITIGEAMALFSPIDSRNLSLGSICRVDCAGAEANVARILGLSGAKVSWISAVGTDLLGDIVLAAMTEDGVDVSMVKRDSQRPTGAIFKSQGVSERGVHYLRSGSAASAMDYSDFKLSQTSKSRYIHVTGITAALSKNCFELVESIIHEPRDGRRFSFDINFRKNLWQVDASKLLLNLAQNCDLVFVGLDEAAELWNVSTPNEIRNLLGNDVDLVVKNSEVDAQSFIGKEKFVAPTPKRSIVEPIGAGDAFAAGYLLGELLEFEPLDSLNLGHKIAGIVLNSPLDTPKASDLTGIPRLRG